MTAPAFPAYTPQHNGVYPGPGDSALARAAFLRDGGVWRTVDLSASRDKSDLLAEVARALDFPGHFGGNWDALADSLEDLSWLAASRIAVEVRAAGTFARAAPESWRAALDIFERAASYWRDRGKTFVVFASGAPGLRNTAV